MKLLINLNEDRELRKAVLDMVDASIRSVARSEVEQKVSGEIDKKMSTSSIQYKIDRIANDIVNKYQNYTDKCIKDNIDAIVRKSVANAVADIVPGLVTEAMKTVDINQYAKDLIEAKVRAGINVRLV